MVWDDVGMRKSKRGEERREGIEERRRWKKELNIYRGREVSREREQQMVAWKTEKIKKLKRLTQA